MKAPDELTLINGKLKGRHTSAQKHLREWQDRRCIVDGTQVCVITRRDLQGLFDELDLARSVAGIA